MSRAALQAMTSDIVDAFVDAGLADLGAYTAPGGIPVDCRIIVDRNTDIYGTLGKVTHGRVVLTLLLEEIPAPLKGAIVAVDGDIWRLVERVDGDAACAKWLAEVGA